MESRGGDLGAQALLKGADQMLVTLEFFEGRLRETIALPDFGDDGLPDPEPLEGRAFAKETVGRRVGHGQRRLIPHTKSERITLRLRGQLSGSRKFVGTQHASMVAGPDICHMTNDFADRAT